jgi:hypothetical protein
MARTDAEIEAAIVLHKKIRTNGLQRAIDIMEPTEKAYARRLICHALEDMIAPKVTAGEPQSHSDGTPARPDLGLLRGRGGEA